MTTSTTAMFRSRAMEDAPGVQLLRALWGIPVVKAPRDVAPANVSTNIYDTGLRPRSFPRRRPARF